MSVRRVGPFIALALLAAASPALLIGCGGDLSGGGTPEPATASDPFVLTTLPEHDEDHVLKASEALSYIFEDDAVYVIRGRVLEGSGTFYTAILVDIEVDETDLMVCTDNGCSLAGCCPSTGSTSSPASIVVRFVREGSQEAVPVEAPTAFKVGSAIEVIGTFHEIKRESRGDIDRIFYATGYRVLPDAELDKATEQSRQPKDDTPDMFVRDALPEVERDFRLVPSEAHVIFFEDDRTYIIRGCPQPAGDESYSILLIEVDEGMT